MTRAHTLLRPCGRRSRRGVTMIETLLALALFAAVSTTLFVLANDRIDRERAHLVGRQLQDVSEAAERYITDHARQFERAAGPAVPFTLNAAGDSGAFAPTVLVNAGYLPPSTDGWSETAWGQDIRILVRRVALDKPALDGTSAPALARTALEAMVVATGGDNIPLDQLNIAARAVGGLSGVGVDPARYDARLFAAGAGEVNGLGDSWRADPGAWGYAGPPIRLARLLPLREETRMPDAIARARDGVGPGMDQSFEMSTDLHMGHRVIENVDDVELLNDLDNSGPNAGVNFKYFEHIEDDPDHAPVRLSEGVYSISEHSHGHTVPKPTCPDGLTPEIFVSPRAVSGRDGLPLKQFVAYARDEGDVWALGMSVLTSSPDPGDDTNVFTQPPFGGHVLVAIVKCAR